VLEEPVAAEGAGIPVMKTVIPNAISRCEDPLRVNVSFAGMTVGKTYYISVYAKNLAEPFVKGNSSAPFPVRIVS